MSDVTQILHQIESGRPGAVEQLLPIVYDELRRLAASKLAGEKPGQTLNATALVHEAYLRLVGSQQQDSNYRQRSHFLAAAAQAMRRILIEQARRKLAQKRGGQFHRSDQDVAEVAAPQPDADLLALHEALDRLAAEDPLKARIVELRYFVGLTGDETAEVLEISPATVDRHWAFARAWLQTAVRG